MNTHRYRVGDLVIYRSPRAHAADGGTFTIELLMPANAVENQYRVVRTSDGHRRLAGEAELSIA